MRISFFTDVFGLELLVKWYCHFNNVIVLYLCSYINYLRLNNLDKEENIRYKNHQAEESGSVLSFVSVCCHSVLNHQFSVNGYFLLDTPKTENG